MRFLLDENLSPLLVELLADIGHDAVHVRSIGMHSATDNAVLERAVAEERILISADTDFGDLLAVSNAPGPSVVLIRRQVDRRASAIAALLHVNLPALEDDLSHGALVVFDNERIRVRALPMRPA